MRKNVGRQQRQRSNPAPRGAGDTKPRAAPRWRGVGSDGVSWDKIALWGVVWEWDTEKEFQEIAVGDFFERVGVVFLRST